MNSKDFNEIIENRLKVCKETLNKKADEYSTEDNRLHNFQVAQHTAGKGVNSVQKALWCMANKHFVSVIDIVDKMNESDYIPTKELISEKITDSINYLLLLEASIEDERGI